MSKSKKHKTPNIPVSVLARPRLDALLEQPHQTSDLDALENATRALMRELGDAPVMDALVKSVEGATGQERALRLQLGARLHTDAHVTRLWTLVKKRGGMSDPAKHAALALLKAMGEEVNLDQPAQYLPSPRPKPLPTRLPTVSPGSPPPFPYEDETGEALSAEDDEQIREIVQRLNFSAPVERLLHLGRPQEKWRDYSMDGITADDIPELIRMATSRELNRAPYPSDLVWAPIHAWRALGQLRAVEAVEPLAGLLRYVDEEDDDWIGEDLPRALSLIGPAALPTLDAYLADERQPLWARVAAQTSIHDIGEKFPESRDACITVLTTALERYDTNDPILNADLIYGLTRFQATGAVDLMEKAFAADRVDESVAGDWEDAQIRLGLKTARSKPPRPTWLDSFRL